MTTEPAQAQPPVPSGPGRNVRVVSVLGVVLSLFLVAAGCSTASPTLEPLGSSDTAPADAAASDTVGSAPVSSVGGFPTGAGNAETSEADTAALAETVVDEPTAEPVLVGLLLDNSNVMAGTDRQPGVAFVEAIDRLAAEGGLDGRPVEVRWVNTTSRLSVIDAEAAELLEAGVDLLVVTCELDFARPAVDRAVEAGVLIVAPCGPEPAWGSGELGPTVFSMMPAVEELGAVMAEHVWAEGHREVSIVVDETAPEPQAECRGFRERWEALGGRVATAVAVNLVTAEALAQDGDRLDDLEADAMVLCSFVRVGLAVIESVRGQASQMPIIAGPTLDTGVWIPEDVAAPLRDFTMLTLASTAGDDPVDAVLGAAAEFLVADGVPPANGRFVLGADLAAAYGLAVTRAGTTDGGAVADALRSMVDEPLVSGEVSFAGRQAPSSWPLRIMRHEAGVFVNDGLVVDPSAQ